MTFVSKLAMATVLTLGASALGSAPAFAQKDKQAAAPELKVSEEFRKPAAAADVALKAKDLATADTQISAAEAVAKNDDEKYYSAYLRLLLELERKNETGQMKALSILASSPKTPPDRIKVYGAIYNYMVGAELIKQRKASEAIAPLLKARELGSTESDLPVLLANAYSATGKPAEAIAEVSRAIEATKAAGRKPPADWYKFAIPKVNATGDRVATADWLKRFIAEYPTAQNWRWAIQITRLASPAGAGKTDKLNLYRLMRATNALADRGDYADYGFAAQQAGLPWEAVSVIDEGRKSGKIPAGDADVGRTYTASQAAVKSEGSLETLAKQSAAAKDGRTAQQTGDAFLASGNYARAVELYDVALQKGSVDADEVNLNRGVALRALGRKDEARTAFQAVKGAYANTALLWQASVDFPPLA
ncbi:tetratricopeptide repeat protein [Sphingomonas sp. LM7]|uniref:tetratricopeptide repeat protein n=1 Tax=Sphingomonas sp. LM7 TaxID=1938607 RepID=UPI000983D929|nr:tetratricopeptide repeat protein [Sphingomonas sp. LM7]AQR72916.1 hypothetical protein BXU08_03805 [Sphingomonas sp. LM7]